MPKLPDATNLSGVNIGAPRSLVDIPVPNISGAFNSVAQGVSDVGKAAYSIEEDRRERAKKQERFDTKMGLIKADEEVYNRTKDLDRLDPQYPEKVRAAKRDVYGSILSGVKDPETRMQFDLETEQDYIQSGIKADVEHKTARTEKTKIDLQTYADAQIKRLVDDGADPEKARASVLQMIEDAELDQLSKLELGKTLLEPLDTAAVKNKAVKLYTSGGTAADKAAAVLRKFEGFRSEPYYDVDNYRVGYGSDTVTLADGSVVKVRQGMTISKADAERDLKRRTGEFMAAAARDSGEAWNNLSPDQQAALTSVAYNYGSLPKRVVRAIQTGDANAIANAVESLADHNGGVNRKRREAEAAVIRGGAIPAGWSERPSIDDVIAQVEQDPSYLRLSVDQRESVKTSISTTLKKAEEENKVQLEALKSSIKTAVASDIATIENGGTASGDLSYDRIASVLGEKEAQAWRNDTADAAERASVTSDFLALPNAEIEATVNEYEAAVEATKGTPEYSRKLKNLEKVKTKQKAIIAERKQNPSQAAFRYSSVQKAYQQYLEIRSSAATNPNQDRNKIITDAFGQYLQATTEAQVGFGIARQGVAIVPDDVAQSVAGLFLDLPANITGAAGNVTARDTLSRVYEQLNNTFGDYTDEVIAYSLAKTKPLSRETTEVMVGLLGSLAKGKSIRRAATDTAQRLQDADAADPGLMGFFDWFNEDKPADDMQLGNTTDETLPIEDTAGAR